MEDFNLKTLAEKELISYYRLIFAAAYSDGSMEKVDVLSIFESLDIDHISKKGKEKIYDCIINKPDITSDIKVIEKSSKELKFATIVGIVETILIDDILADEEKVYLDLVCSQLRINDEQKDAIINFVEEGKRIQREGLNDNDAEMALKGAISGLSGVGVPIAAVYFSGTVLGLSAAGVTSGLAALGLGFGMVPGIGTAVLIGVGVFIGLKKLMGNSKKEKEKLISEQTKRKMQLVIKNLQESINKIIDNIKDLEIHKEQNKKNKDAILMLNKRLYELQKILENRSKNHGRK